MEKNKRDLMILIAILFIGLNYVIYTYFIVYKLDTVKQAKSKYVLKTKKLNSLKAKKKSIETKQHELKKLKEETSSFDSMVPTQIDTPQLIYDFYKGCKSFGVNGQNISFELLNGDNSSNNSNNNNFHTLIIDLKITGNKANIENFIRNVKSITIGSSDEEEADNDELKSSDDEVNTDNINKSVDNSKKNGDELPGEIVFYQYVQGSGNINTKVPNDYIFYDSQKQGFNSIADMFK